jgi:hypothetical protein
MKPIRIGLLLAGLLLHAVPGFAQSDELTRPRIWTSVSGAELKAKFVELAGDRVVLKNRRGEPIQIPRAKLSAADQALLDDAYGPAATPAAFEEEFDTPDPGMIEPEDTLEIAPAEAPPAPEQGPVLVGGTEIPLAQKTTFHRPLDAESIKALKKENNDATEAEVGLWLPPNFDPEKEWSILLVSATANSSSIGHMDSYLESAKQAGGWIVIAADGPFSAPSGDSTQWRWRMARAGLLALDAAWPGARNWPIATGGFSGGAKRSALLGAILCKDDWTLIGMYMGGCNEDYAKKGQKEYRPKRSLYRKAPVYLSVGKKDATATTMSVNKVRLSMEANGLKYVRMETYKGGHTPNKPQITEALEWFKEIEAKKAAGPTNTRRSSRLRLPPPAPSR